MRRRVAEVLLRFNSIYRLALRDGACMKEDSNGYE